MQIPLQSPAFTYKLYFKSVSPCTCYIGVWIHLNGVAYANHGIVTITDIGTDRIALLCSTTLPGCCSSANPETQWYFPNGSHVLNPGERGTAGYYRTRSTNPPRSMLLHRNPQGTTTGIFRCDILDDSGTIRSLYVGIYTSTTGE